VRQFRQAARPDDGPRPLLLSGQPVFARMFRAGKSNKQCKRAPSGARFLFVDADLRGAGHPLRAQVPPSMSSGAWFGARQAVNTRLPATRRTHVADGATFALDRIACPALPSRSVAARRNGQARTAARGSRRTSRVACQAKSCFDERRRAGHPQAGVCGPPGSGTGLANAMSPAPAGSRLRPRAPVGLWAPQIRCARVVNTPVPNRRRKPKQLQYN